MTHQFHDLTTAPANGWAHVDFGDDDTSVLVEVPLTFGDCELCGALIGTGDPMICDECVNQENLR
jgi:hypothetical protein